MATFYSLQKLNFTKWHLHWVFPSSGACRCVVIFSTECPDCRKLKALRRKQCCCPLACLPSLLAHNYGYNSKTRFGQWQVISLKTQETGCSWRSEFMENSQDDVGIFDEVTWAVTQCIREESGVVTSGSRPRPEVLCPVLFIQFFNVSYYIVF